MLVGDEIITIEDVPDRTPGSGGATAMCPDHMVAYERRSRSYRRNAQSCFRRGFPVALNGRHVLTCSVHLQDQLAEVTGRMENGGPLPSAVRDGPQRKKTALAIDGDLDQEIPTNPPPWRYSFSCF